jgi:hypothetical protein
MACNAILQQTALVLTEPPLFSGLARMQTLACVLVQVLAVDYKQLDKLHNTGLGISARQQQAQWLSSQLRKRGIVMPA